ncbi:acyl carrier protein [Cupriavidus gilardii J11]|uniref:Acyl carrier protein n=1 Tax=Cupriavidus gilardii J11 TaxID=936133 RepID=A0A562B9G9_9BURK|nr:phosphopantetheine-binding protein [Cupriavidus gilardii]TWG81836.1 acyl carrier protein [Cupriavidus gilardii J11]
MKALEQEIKELIISSLSLEDMTVDDLPSDVPLFVDGIGLDSIDALELGLALQKRYGLAFDGDKEQMRERFASVASLASFVADRLAARGAQ